MVAWCHLVDMRVVTASHRTDMLQFRNIACLIADTLDIRDHFQHGRDQTQIKLATGCCRSSSLRHMDSTLAFFAVDLLIDADGAAASLISPSSRASPHWQLRFRTVLPSRSAHCSSPQADCQNGFSIVRTSYRSPVRLSDGMENSFSVSSTSIMSPSRKNLSYPKHGWLHIMLP